ncbi:MAG: hypothetical protein ACYSSP_05245 [Planctomycetota bacterium]
MARCKYLTDKQRAVLDDFFSGEYNEEELRKKHHLKKGTLRRWLSKDLFFEGFERSVKYAQLRSAALLASNSQVAVMKLVELTESKSAETARKACLDIIGFGVGKGGQGKMAVKSKGIEDDKLTFGQQISQEKASRLLAVLAE